MKPPPPMPENSGSTTFSANWIAAAASIALPPSRSIFAPASAASGCETATTPPRNPGSCGTARPEPSCDAQLGAKLRAPNASASRDLRMFMSSSFSSFFLWRSLHGNVFLEQLELDLLSHQEVAEGVRMDVVAEVEDRVHEIGIGCAADQPIEVDHAVEVRLVPDPVVDDVAV